MPRVITYDKITEGMVLAEPIINNYGQTLLPAGVELKASHIRILKTWNIRLVKVKGDNTEALEYQISPEMISNAQDILSKRMTWKPRNAAEMDMFKCGVIYLANIMTKKIVESKDD